MTSSGWNSGKMYYTAKVTKFNALSKAGVITANKFVEKSKHFACINFRESINIEFFAKVSAPKVQSVHLGSI